MDTPEFAHEQFRPYQHAVTFLSIAARLQRDVPRGYAPLRDQLRRAATSISLNIAEGTGRNSDNERRQFYSIARGSAFECAAIVDALVAIGCVRPGTGRRAKQPLLEIVRVLTVCIRRPQPKQNTSS